MSDSPQSGTAPTPPQSFDLRQELDPGHSSSRLLVCAATGALGVVSGFAVFFLFIEERDEPLKFISALALAAIVSCVFEWLRELISHNEHWSYSKILGTLCAVAVAEFFVMAADKTVALSWDPRIRDGVFRAIGGSSIDADSSAWDLYFLAGLWVFVGFFFGGWLSAGICKATGKLSEQVWLYAQNGAVGGAVIAPLIAVLFIIARYFLHAVFILLWVPEAWSANSRRGTEAIGKSGPLVGAVLLALAALLYVAWRVTFKMASPLLRKLPPRPGRVGKGLKGLAYIILAAVAVCFGVIAWSFGTQFVLGALAPLAARAPEIGMMCFAAACIWGIPGAVLGGLTPLLNRPSGRPAVWGVIALAAAVVLVAMTVLRFDERWWALTLLVPLLLLPLSMTVSRGRPGVGALHVEAHWPAMALAAGTLSCASMMGLHELASFAGVYQRFQSLSRPQDLSPWNADSAKRLLNPVFFMHRLKSLELSLSSANDGKEQLRTWKEQLSDLAFPEQGPGAETRIDGKRFRRELDKVAHAPFHEQIEVLAELQRKVKEEAKDIRDKALQAETIIDRAQGIETEMPSEQTPTKLFPLADRDVLLGKREFTDAELRADRERRASLLAQLKAVNAENLAAKTALIKEAGAFRESLGHAMVEVSAVRRDVLEPKEREHARWFEVAMAGSFGFWTTLGLLAGWSQLNHSSADATEGHR